MSTVPTPSNPFAAAELGLPALQEIFLLPGDWAIYLLAARLPGLASALGVGPADYGGGYAAVLSFWCWVLLSLVLIAVASAVRRFGRAVASMVAGAYADVLYRIRMLRAISDYKRRAQRQHVEPTFDGEPR